MGAMVAIVYGTIDDVGYGYTNFNEINDNLDTYADTQKGYTAGNDDLIEIYGFDNLLTGKSYTGNEHKYKNHPCKQRP